MTLKEARLAAGYTIEEVEEVFGISKRTLLNWEKGMDVSPQLKEMLIRELIRTPKSDLGVYAVIGAPKVAISAELPEEYEVIVRCNTQMDALFYLDQATHIVAPKKTDNSNFYELGAWRCGITGKPEKCLKHIVVETR